MNRHGRVRWAAAALLILTAVCCLVAAAHGRKASTQAAVLTQTTEVVPSKASQPGEAAARGRRIYFEGEDGTADEVRVTLGSTEIDAPATAFACANCHGADGEGTSEGGIKPARINWEALNAPRNSTLTGRPRPPYDERTLARAIRLGINSAGEPLQAAMPLYRLTDRQAADLISFLKILGTDADADPGLTPDSIKVGAALPLTGPYADTGLAARATLAAYFAEANTLGGVYGRRFELVVKDSGGTVQGTLGATRELLEVSRVFALVGCFEPAGDVTGVGAYLRRKAVPLIGPLTLTPRPPATPNPSIFYLLPTVRDQARALVEYIRDATERARGGAPGVTKLALVSADDALNREAAEGARAQARGMTLSPSRVYRAGEFTAKDIAGELGRAGAQYVLFFGGPAEFAELARELERQRIDIRLGGLTLTVGREALNLPPTMAARTLLAHPTPLPGQADLAEFSSVLRRAGGGGAGQLAFRAIAFAAAKTFTEGIKLSGRRLNRAGLFSSLEQLRDFNTGVLPPLTFGPNRRLGVTGAYVVGVDVSGRRFTHLSDWIELNTER